MDESRESANWKAVKWILASLEKCHMNKGDLNPVVWDIPARERKIAAEMARRQREQKELADAANDPARLAAIKAARRANFNRFVSSIKGR